MSTGVVEKARAIGLIDHSHTCESQDEEEPGLPCDCQNLGYGQDVALALLRAVEALETIAGAVAGGEERYKTIARARETLAALGHRAGPTTGDGDRVVPKIGEQLGVFPDELVGVELRIGALTVVRGGSNEPK